MDNLTLDAARELVTEHRYGTHPLRTAAIWLLGEVERLRARLDRLSDYGLVTKLAAIKSGNDATRIDALHALINRLRTIRKILWALGVTDAADHVEDAIACAKQRLGENSPPTDMIPDAGAAVKCVSAAQLMWCEAKAAAAEKE